MEFKVEDNRISLYDADKRISWVVYKKEGDCIHLIETHTAKGYEGKGYAGKVVEYALNIGEKFDKIKVSCPYIKHWMGKKKYESEKIEFTELLKFKENIDFFNKYHEPEAKAEYISYEDGIVSVRFSGPFCRSCGVYDYFEDIIQDVPVKIIGYEENDDDSFTVKYKLEKL